MAIGITPAPFQSGYRLIDGSQLNTQLGHPVISTQDTITATVGGGQTNAFLLRNRINHITGVATAGDSVKLPTVPQGKMVVVTNDSLNAVQVFGSGTDTINNIATATGISQAAGTTVTYTSPVAGKWYTSGSIGANAGQSTGTFTLNGVTPVTVANTAITANSQVLITLKNVNGGTVGTSAPNVRTITVATGFTVAGIAADTGIYNYSILN